MRKKIRSYHFMIGIALLGFVWPNMPSTSSTMGTTPKWASEFRPYGAYVDELQFIIFTEEEAALAIVTLETGGIDAYDEQKPENMMIGIRDENVEITITPNVRYRVLNLNCERFPTNITAFRRAMAFALDKSRATVECWGGLVQPQDSFIPQYLTEWEVESERLNPFYEADFISGNMSLEKAGFKDLDSDGWREYDTNNNEVWDPEIDLDDDDYADGGIMELFATAEYDPAIRVCDIMVDGLEKMGIRAVRVEMDRLATIHWDLLINSWCKTWLESVPIINIPKLLYDSFRTGAMFNREPYNYYHFSNSTIDAILDQMAESTNLEDVKTYAREANRLLTFEQPQIAIYNDVNINLYRTDKFEGFFEFKGLGTSSGENQYVGTKVFLKESLGGPYGGTFKYSLSGEFDTLNPYLQSSRYDRTVFQYVYEKLWNIDPITWDPIPGLAYDWEIESTTANGEIQDGQKFTFYLYENEIWHDGELFTAADVNHSIYLWKSSPLSGPEMADVYKIEMPDGPEGYTIELYVNKTGYFEWADTTHFYITPEHIWRDVTNVSVFTPNFDQIIGTGPYKWHDYRPGEFVSLLRHEDWRWDIRDVPIPPSSSSEEIITRTTKMPSSQSSTAENIPGYTPEILLVTLTVLLFKKSQKKGRKYQL